MTLKTSWYYKFQGATAREIIVPKICNFAPICFFEANKWLKLVGFHHKNKSLCLFLNYLICAQCSMLTIGDTRDSCNEDWFIYKNEYIYVLSLRLWSQTWRTTLRFGSLEPQYPVLSSGAFVVVGCCIVRIAQLFLCVPLSSSLLCCHKNFVKCWFFGITHALLFLVTFLGRFCKRAIGFWKPISMRVNPLCKCADLYAHTLITMFPMQPPLRKSQYFLSTYFFT